MGKLTNFMDKASPWKIYLACFIFCSLTVMAVTYFIPMDKYTLTMKVKLSIALGLLFGFMIGWTITIMKQSAKFWEMARNLEAKVEEANCKTELTYLLEKDFKELADTGSGEIHNTELVRLHTMLTTKHKFVI